MIHAFSMEAVRLLARSLPVALSSPGDLVENSGVSLTLRGEGLTAGDAARFVDIIEAEENAPMRNNNCRTSSREDLQHFAEAILAR